MCTRLHPIERARERYGLTLTEADIFQLERGIRAGEAVLVRRERWGDSVYMVRHATDVLVAVYGDDFERKPRIITFLPAEALKSGARYRRIHDGRPMTRRRGR